MPGAVFLYIIYHRHTVCMAFFVLLGGMQNAEFYEYSHALCLLQSKILGSGLYHKIDACKGERRMRCMQSEAGLDVYCLSQR